MEVSPGGGSDRAETDPEAEGVLFVVEGIAILTVNCTTHDLTPGGYASLPPQSGWTLRNKSDDMLRFHWIRKACEAVEGARVSRGNHRQRAGYRTHHHT